MGLSLDSIYRPFNEFFLSKFDSGAGAPVQFRFSRVPHTFVDSDFLISQHPDWGPSTAMAQEIFSNVVDKIPTLDPDGRNVSSAFGSGLISELYSDEILGPAIPFVPADVTDDTEKQARIDAFNAAKADALGLLEKIPKPLSLLDEGVRFRSSTAMPGKWWDKTASSVWTHQSFQVKGAATAPGQPPQPPDQLLRMKVDDSVLRSVLQAHVVAPTPAQPSPAAAHPAVMLSRPTLLMARPAFAAALANDDARTTEVLRATPAAERAPTAVAIHNDITPAIASFPFRQRMEIQSMIAANAPTQPVVASDVTIGFDYCMASVTRPWYLDAFINNPSWRVPGQPKGQLSANDGHGIPTLPVGFVAIKALSIKAPWTPDDISNLQQSVQFGPFNFDSKLVDGAITHDGIQIIGWMLQKLPDLPPNGAPAS